MGEADGPPVKTSEHCVHGSLGALGTAQCAVGIELFPRTGEAYTVADGDGVQFRKDEAELFDRAQAAGDSAIGDEGNWLGVPLRTERVDEPFKWSRVAMVVLGSDDDECVACGDAPIQGGRIRVSGCGWIDDLYGETFTGGNLGSGPAGNGIAEAARSCRSVNQANLYWYFHVSLFLH